MFVEMKALFLGGVMLRLKALLRYMVHRKSVSSAVNHGIKNVQAFCENTQQEVRYMHKSYLDRNICSECGKKLEREEEKVILERKIYCRKCGERACDRKALELIFGR